MAVLSTESFTADGTQKTFTVSNTILSSSHARIHFYYDDGLGGGATDHTVADGDWDLLGQSTIVFKEAPTSSYVVKITVSSDGSGLDAAPSEISDVTSNMAAILNVNSIDAEIVTVSGVSSDVTTVADDLAKGAGTNQPADSAILNALTNANQTIADAAATAADVLATNADATVTNNNVSLTNADVVSTHADVVLTNADAAQTNLDRIATSADRVQTGLDATATSNDRVAIETIYDNFDDRYLGQFASDPTLDNDGQALLVGSMYFNTVDDTVRFYNGVAWENPELTATQAASTATTQAGIATTKASEASGSASAASTAATTSTTNLGLFEAQYESSPTPPLNPVGGKLWFDEANGLMKVYDGAGWVNAGSSVNGVEKSEEFIATGGQTVFTVSLGYDSGFVNVFREGMLLGESEYTADNGSTVTLNVACTAGDIVKVQAFGAFTLADHYSKTEVLGSFGNLSSPLLDLPLNNNLSMKAGAGSVTFSRATTATYIDRYGVLKYAGIDEPRFEADGLLIEGASTNLFKYSGEFDNAIWNKGDMTITPDAVVSPDGTTTAYKAITNDTVADGFLRTSITYVSDTSYSCSIFAKVGETTKIRLQTGTAAFGVSGNCVFDLVSKTTTETGTLTGSKLTELSNGWFRCELFAVATVSITTDFGFTIHTSTGDTGDGTSGMYIWGAQLEALPFASSYIPTTTSAVTRSATNKEVTASGNVGTSKSMTIIADVSLSGLSASHQTICKVGSIVVYARLTTSGVVEVFNGANNSVSTIDLSDGLVKRIAVVFDTTNGYIYSDGVLNTTFSTVDAGTTAELLIGKWSSSQWYLDGNLKNFKIYDKALTATEVALS